MTIHPIPWRILDQRNDRFLCIVIDANNKVIASNVDRVIAKIFIDAINGLSTAPLHLDPATLEVAAKVADDWPVSRADKWAIAAAIRALGSNIEIDMTHWLRCPNPQCELMSACTDPKNCGVIP